MAHEAVTRLGVPASGISGLALSLLGILTEHPVLLGIGLMALVIVVMASWQTRTRRPLPLPILAVSSTTFAAVAPFGEGGLRVSTVPVLIVLGFLGVFTLPRQVAVRFALYSAILVVWAIYWLYPGLLLEEVLVTVAVLGGTAVCGFLVFIWADEARIKQEEAFRILFEASPIATWEEDYREVVQWLESLRRAGVTDLRDYLGRRRALIRHGAGLIRIGRVNAAGAAMEGFSSPDEVVNPFTRPGRDDRELDSFLEAFVALWEGRTEAACDLSGVDLNGRRLEAVLHMTVPRHHGRPDFSRVIITISDITPRRIAEEQLAEALASNEQLVSQERALATCSRALLLGGDDDSLHIALDTLRAAIGAERGYLSRVAPDPEGGDLLEVVVASERSNFRSDDRVGLRIPASEWPEGHRLLAAGDVFRGFGERDGQSVSWLAVPISSGGRWLGMFGLEDLGPRVWLDAEVKLLMTAAPMFGTHWEREDSRVRLEDLVRSKDQFVASVSHELRTPLAAVVGFAELLRAEVDSLQSSDLAEMLEVIAVQSQDMANMVEDLLVAARADIGTITLRPQDVYLRAQAEVAMGAINLGQKLVEVRGDSGLTWADPARTRQIIRNLLTNAVRYGGDNVIMETETGSEVTRLRVIDDGPGLPPADWERIFEAYQRAHDHPTQPASIGLGLTVSRQLAQLMGGDLSYTQVDGKSCFELRLPRRPRSTEEGSRQAAAPQASVRP
ncbi:MAG TPA: GAF domain-containing sensor histidine kinase [Acidimicrobiia bacterium]|nr:GAF domain-containing sensor histidine kinase [Acidimicrobiia bacterium]